MANGKRSRGSFFASLARPLVSLFFPPHCYACSSASDGIRLVASVCEECWSGLGLMGEFICFRCGRALDSSAPAQASETYFCARCRGKRVPYKFMRSLYHYRSPLREILHLFKFEGMMNTGAELGSRLAFWAAQQQDLRRADMVIPVPLHPLRRLQRGFNQSEFLAGFVSAKLGLPLLSTALKRRRNTPPQSLSDSTRTRAGNVKGAYAAKKGLERKRVLLVDDVATSEATVRECARVLRRAGVREVFVLTLARSPD